MAMGKFYQWTRAAVGSKVADPYFQRSMSNTVIAGLVYQICELYIDDVLIHVRNIESVLANVRNVFGETAGAQYSCTRKKILRRIL
jgi:hypothetical protein